jgi:hypothetical protein
MSREKSYCRKRRILKRMVQVASISASTTYDAMCAVIHVSAGIARANSAPGCNTEAPNEQGGGHAVLPMGDIPHRCLQDPLEPPAEELLSISELSTVSFLFPSSMFLRAGLFECLTKRLNKLQVRVNFFGFIQ